MPNEFNTKITLEASLSPSEDIDKVIEAMKNVLGGSHAEVSRRGGTVRLFSDDRHALDMLRNQLRDRQVRGAARRVLLSETVGDLTTVMLNRQAAAVGVIALCNSPDQSPLGPIYVRLQSKEISAVIDWLTAYDSG